MLVARSVGHEEAESPCAEVGTEAAIKIPGALEIPITGDHVIELDDHIIGDGSAYDQSHRQHIAQNADDRGAFEAVALEAGKEAGDVPGMATEETVPVGIVGAGDLMPIERTRAPTHPPQADHADPR